MNRPVVALTAAALAVAVATCALPALVSAHPAERVVSVDSSGVAASAGSARRAAAIATADTQIAAAAYTAPRSARSTGGSSDSARVRSLLAALKRKYRLLDGVTVRVGRTPGGYQAVSYYKVGRIVVSPKHRASLSRIMNHEIWHIIDWRDNHRINWRESVPPRNASSYRK